MVTRAELYERVNATWPMPRAELPALTGPEAVRAARKLLRFAGCKSTAKLPIVVTSGNRYTWTHSGTLRVNPDHGWHRLVHDISHLAHSLLAHRRLHKGVAPHAKQHARLERRMVAEVVKRGWLDGRLRDQPRAAKPAPSPEDERAAKIAHARSMLARAETRLKRVMTIMRKWRRSLAALERYQSRSLASRVPEGV